MFSKMKCCLSLIPLVIILGCERDVFTGYEEPILKNYKLAVNSNPSNAKIYINGKNSGYTTPSLFAWVKPWNDTLTLKLNLYRDTSIITEFYSKTEQKYFIDFKSNTGNYGNISCVSSPVGASILRNKMKTYRTTPNTLSKVEVGIHLITLLKEGHRADSTNVTLAAGQTLGAYIVLEDTTKWVSYKPENSLVKSNLVYSITTDNNNNIWIGSSDGLSKFDGRNWKVFTSNNSVLRSNVITSLKKDKKNRIWVGTSKGIYLIENDIVSDVSFNLQNQSVVDIAESSNGTIWAALNGGITKLNGNSWQLFTSANSGLKDNYPLCIEIDFTDRIWIGSRYSGILILDNNNWDYISTSSMNIAGLESGINSICFAEDGTVWVGTIASTADVGKIVYLRNNIWNSYTRNEFKSNLARQIISYKGNIIIAGSSGLGIISKSGTFSYFKYGNSKLYELLMRDVAVDKNDNIWIATYSCGAGRLKKALE
ncbi:MAG: PEGA domain-containing protein [Ignavibacteriales bacterium]|nr:PEGA domain-containing protein [Ignavibacteriales bacterium]